MEEEAILNGDLDQAEYAAEQIKEITEKIMLYRNFQLIEKNQ